jgi:hypothetical protein
VTTETDLPAQERIRVFQKQLRDSLELSGVRYSAEIAANIEGLIVSHIMRLLEEGASVRPLVTS